MLARMLGVVSVLSLALGVVMPSPTSSNPASYALVSAAGNVVGTADMQPAAIYYWGWYDTREICMRKVRELNATGRFWGGGCTLEGSGPHKGKWRLWMDEKDCTDRIGPTRAANGIDAQLLQP